MPLCISRGVLLCLEYPSKVSSLHEYFNYIVYIQYYIDFDCIIRYGSRVKWVNPGKD